jgi:hypothetical protein
MNAHRRALQMNAKPWGIFLPDQGLLLLIVSVLALVVSAGFGSISNKIARRVLVTIWGSAAALLVFVPFVAIIVYASQSRQNPLNLRPIYFYFVTAGLICAFTQVYFVIYNYDNEALANLCSPGSPPCPPDASAFKIVAQIFYFSTTVFSTQGTGDITVVNDFARLFFYPQSLIIFLVVSLIRGQTAFSGTTGGSAQPPDRSASDPGDEQSALLSDRPAQSTAQLYRGRGFARTQRLTKRTSQLTAQRASVSGVALEALLYP